MAEKEVRLIDANELKDGLEHHFKYTDQKYENERQWAIGYNAGLNRALYSIAYAKTIDPESLRPHGKWIGKPIAGYGIVRCSNCRSIFMENSGKWRYCPNCGAKMEE